MPPGWLGSDFRTGASRGLKRSRLRRRAFWCPLRFAPGARSPGRVAAPDSPSRTPTAPLRGRFAVLDCEPPRGVCAGLNGQAQKRGQPAAEPGETTREGGVRWWCEVGRVEGRCPPHEWVRTPSGRVVCLWCEKPRDDEDWDEIERVLRAGGRLIGIELGDGSSVEFVVGRGVPAAPHPRSGRSAGGGGRRGRRGKRRNRTA